MTNIPFSKVELLQMIKSFNKRGGKQIKTKQNKKELYADLKRNQSRIVPVSKCVMKSLHDIKDDSIFKVSGPTNTGEWLSTVDIDNIMTQYQDLHTDFMYLGTVPIDFKKVYPEIFNVNTSKNKTLTKYGIIFNTDPSNKSGEHWIALFIDNVDKSICFFDSNGTSPPKQVSSFIKKLNRGGKYNVYINEQSHQKRNGSCGLYALNFIISGIKGRDCVSYFKCIKSDKHIEKSRGILFK